MVAKKAFSKNKSFTSRKKTTAKSNSKKPKSSKRDCKKDLGGNPQKGSVNLFILPNYNVFSLSILLDFFKGLLKLGIIFILIMAFIFLLDNSFGSHYFISFFQILLFLFIALTFFIYMQSNIHKMILVDHRKYQLLSNRLTFRTGIFNKKREFIPLEDIIHVDLVKQGIISKLFDTNIIIFRTRISYYDPVTIPCVKNSHELYMEIDKIISDYKFEK